MEGVKSKAESQGQDGRIMSVNVHEFQDIETREKVADISKRDDEIADLNAKISQLRNSHTVDMKRLKGKLTAKSVLVSGLLDELNQKHDEVMSFTQEVVSLKEKIQNMTRENNIFKNKKANMAEPHGISYYKRRIEVLENAFKGSRDQVATLQNQLESKEAQEIETREKVTRFEADISKRDDEITDLNVEIGQLRISHVEDMERSKRELTEKSVLVDQLMSCAQKVKVEVTEMEIAINRYGVKGSDKTTVILA